VGSEAGHGHDQVEVAAELVDLSQVSRDESGALRLRAVEVDRLPIRGNRFVGLLLPGQTFAGPVLFAPVDMNPATGNPYTCGTNPNVTFCLPVPGTNGAGRNIFTAPSYWNLDLGFYYPIKFSESKELRFTLDWFNVTNTQRAVTTDTTFSLNSGIAGIPPVQNPFFGQGLIFQYPSAIRIGGKFTF